MARNKLVDMIGKLSEEQVERLSGIAMEYLDLNSKVKDTAPKSCPCCGAANAHFIKRGFSGRKQRYQGNIDASVILDDSHSAEGLAPLLKGHGGKPCVDKGVVETGTEIKVQPISIIE